MRKCAFWGRLEDRLDSQKQVISYFAPSLMAACPALSKTHENGPINPAFSPQTCGKSILIFFGLVLLIL